MNAPSSTSDTSSSSRHTLVWAIPLSVVGLLLIVIISGLAFANERRSRFEGRIYPGVSINRVDVSGLRTDEAHVRLQSTLEIATKNGLNFQLGTTTRTLPQAQMLELIRYDYASSIAEAYDLGRESTTLPSLFRVLGLSLRGKNLNLPVTLEEEGLRMWLREATAPLLPEAKNARLVIDLPSATTSLVRIEAERSGQTVQLEPALQEAKRQAETQQFYPIQLTIETLEPAIHSRDLEPLQTQATTWLTRAPFDVTLDQKKWSVSPGLLASWITATSTDLIAVALDSNRLKQDITPWISSSIRLAKDGKLILDENKAVKEFIAPEEGVSLDTTATVHNIERVLNNTSSTAPLVLVRETPKILGDGETLGIREVLGVGRSNFSGSPTNRRKNMALGVKHVNGVIIPPGEEFSQLKVLGEIDGAHGWFPELVIKGNKTTPEFGGGLCQVGTTSFRMALNAGFKITERRNHSYRVRYYEPAGTDATIYDPAPDFRFKNDTAHHILITAAIQNGDDMVFTAWGTKDGRVAKQENYKLYGITAAPATRYIETTDLAPGTVKCTETAHAGASASFDYIVSYADGTNAKETFKSTYKPWGAVCLKGVAAISTPANIDETGINNPN
jgi:vancomycin resistance protein YoaR